MEDKVCDDAALSPVILYDKKNFICYTETRILRAHKGRMDFSSLIINSSSVYTQDEQINGSLDLDEGT